MTEERRIQQAELDPMTQKVEAAAGVGMLGHDAQRNLSPQVLGALVHFCRQYGLDPLLREVVLMYGQPYITIKARRRLDHEAGHRPSIRFRFLTDEEREEYHQAGAMEAGDLIKVCKLTTEHGNTVEAVGIVSREERERKSDRGGFRSPVVRENPIEMVEKRAEYRAREMAYGSIGGMAPDEDDWSHLYDPEKGPPGIPERGPKRLRRPDQSQQATATPPAAAVGENPLPLPESIDHNDVWREAKELGFEVPQAVNRILGCTLPEWRKEQGRTYQEAIDRLRAEAERREREKPDPSSEAGDADQVHFTL